MIPSPGSSSAISVEVNAPVAPKVTTISVSVGSDAVSRASFRRWRAVVRGDPLGERVGAPILADGRDRAVADEGEGRQIADPLTEVDPADPLALAGHPANFGLNHGSDAAGGGGHGRLGAEVLPGG